MSTRTRLLRRLASTPPTDNEPLAALLLVPRLHAFLLAPRADDVASAARTATVRVVDRVHHFSADLRTATLPTGLAGLAPRHQLVLFVADDADRGVAAAVDETHLGRRHAHRDVLAFLGDDLRRHPGRAAKLSALTDLELDVVHRGTERHLGERQRVPGADVRARTRRDRVADGETFRVQDVALLAVRVRDERDARRTVRIVLDRRDRRGHAVLVALEVDDAVLALVTAAASPHGDVAVVVAAARLLDRLEQRLLGLRRRDVGEIRHRAEARALRDRLELSDSHERLALEDLDRIALAERHDRFFPIGTTADVAAHALFLAAHVRRPYAGDFHAEQLLDRRADLRLRRVRMNLEGVLAFRLIRGRCLFGDDRPHDGPMEGRHGLLLPLLLGRLGG